MTAAIPTSEPARLYAGDTWQWTVELADYPAGDGWALSYVFTNAAARFGITAGADGDLHYVNQAAASSASLTPGFYDWLSYVTLGAVRKTVRRGRVEIVANLADEQNLDLRSAARKIRDGLQDAYAAYVATGALRQSYTIAGRQMVFRKGGELLDELNYWKGEVSKEENAERRANGRAVARVVTKL